jgi:hypothetical protein
MKNDIAILISSCDKYSDLWDPCLTLFLKNWPDCPYKIYLVCNNKTYVDDRVCCLQVGDDQDWSSTMLLAISKIVEPNVFIWIDDFFINRVVDTEKVTRIFSLFCYSKMQYLRLSSIPRAEKRVDDNFSEIGENAFYRVSLPLSLWRVDALRKIVSKGETAWEFEINGSRRSKKYNHYYSINYDLFEYIHGVERGVWMRSAVRQLNALGFSIDLTFRRQMSRYENLLLWCRSIKNHIFWLIPEHRRAGVMGFVQNAKKSFAGCGRKMAHR